jgi:hypothetical protein
MVKRDAVLNRVASEESAIGDLLGKKPPAKSKGLGLRNDARSVAQSVPLLFLGAGGVAGKFEVSKDQFELCLKILAQNLTAFDVQAAIRLFYKHLRDCSVPINTKYDN